MIIPDILALARLIRSQHRKAVTKRPHTMYRDVPTIRTLDVTSIPWRCLQSMLVRHGVRISQTQIIGYEGHPQVVFITTGKTGRGKPVEHLISSLTASAYVPDGTPAG